MTQYRGLTWDHPRGYNALAAAARQAERHGISIEWDRQPLEGFEEHPITDLCARYDLVVLDHPHVGEAVEADCLRPLEDVFDPEDLAAIGARTVGPCLASYRYAGRHWALPLDAATQVAAYRADLVAAPPTTWEGVLDLSRSVPVCLSVAGPHAALTLMSIAVSHGATPAVDGRFLPADIGRAALEIMQRLFDGGPEATRTLNPIGILELMADSDTVAFCPLVYGYVNYAAPGDEGKRRIGFANAPSAAGKVAGSVLGGTGIGISRRCDVTPGLIEHLLWLMSEEAQCRFIPAHDGQPSARAAWLDPEVNRRWNDFYVDTVATIEDAHVRPRFNGYIAFQREASAIIRAGLAGRSNPGEVLAELERAYRATDNSSKER